MTESVDTVIIGAGQAGLALSFHFAERNHQHVVLERGRIAERWRTERWDSLMFQFPNATLELPGFAYTGDDPEAFSHKDEIVRFIEDYAERFSAPIRTGVNVESVTSDGRSGRYLVRTSHGALTARNVVVATGPYQRPRVPPIAAALPADVLQLHANEYRNPEALPEGSVLVVGTGASGCQIADELLEAGRRVHVSVGRHRRFPRRYRGRDFIDWWKLLGRYDRLVEESPDSRFGYAPPVITGVHGGYDIDLRRSAARGLQLVGHLTDVAGSRLMVAPGVDSYLDDADQAFDVFRHDVDDHVRRTGIDAPLQPTDTAPSERFDVGDTPAAIDMRAEAIRSVIWATGYELDFGWIDLPIFDDRRYPIHRRGVTAAAGVFFLGLSWLYKAKSAFLSGVGEDASFLAEQITQSA